MTKQQPGIGMAAAVLLTVALAGCATTVDRPTAQLTRAESRIEVAEQNGAQQYGAQALAQARDKLAAAKRATDNGDNEIASRLAREAELDARLAAAQAERRKADTALQEINDSIESLRRETTRRDTY